MTDYRRHLVEKFKVGSFDDFYNFPLFFELETVNVCNARCSICTINEWKSETPFMEDEVFFRLADEINSHSDTVRIVNLSRDGEPFLDSGLEERIAYFKKGGTKFTTLSTNAALLNEKRILSVLASGLDDIMFSVDGATKSTYENIRIGLSFDEVTENIRNFIRLRNASNSSTSVRIRMVMTSENIHEADDFKKMWQDIICPGDKIQMKHLHSWGNQLQGFNAVTEYEKIYTPCSSPFTTCIIKSDGEIIVCPVDFKRKYTNGSIMEKSIAEIWRNGKELNAFRQIHLEGGRNDIPMCEKCFLWDADISKVDMI